jgi:hypothetical protein
MSTTMKFYDAQGNEKAIRLRRSLVDKELTYQYRTDSFVPRNVDPSRAQAIDRAGRKGFVFRKDGRFDTRRFIQKGSV